jgi:hypothetical protein
MPRPRTGLAFALLLGGCPAAEPLTELVVVIDSDLAVPARLDAIALEVETPSGDSLEAEQPLSEAAQLPLTMVLEWRSGPLSPIVVTAWGRKEGRSSFQVTVSTGFVANESRMVRLVLQAQCRAAICEDERVCRGGSCAAPLVPAELLPPFGGAPPDLAGDPGCACDGDLDGNGAIDLDDLLSVADCSGLPPTGECAAADLDCNGLVEMCDVERISCLFSDGESCCDAPCCRCDGDVDGDGRIDGRDVAKVTVCQGSAATVGDCAAADLDCSGAVDACDRNAVVCAQAGGTGCCVNCERVCSCDADLDDSGVTDIDDRLAVLDCVGEIPSGECAAADVDCNGTVDRCDDARVGCAFAGRTDCCAETCCACNGDLTGDRRIELADLTAVLTCFGLPPAGGCTLADLDCDGDVDHCDVQSVQCQVAGLPPNQCCDPSCNRCACDADVNADGTPSAADVQWIVACRGSTDPSCAPADVDCDGAVTQCDAERATCEVVRPGSDCCRTIQCGACCVAGACDLTPQGVCDDRAGAYDGDFSTCPASC